MLGGNEQSATTTVIARSGATKQSRASRAALDSFASLAMTVPGPAWLWSLDKMKVIGLAGWSGAGKTTLLTRVIPLFRAQGLRVSVIKHAHHKFDVDMPGKDSWRHREAGAEEVLVSSGNRWALMHEL